MPCRSDYMEPNQREAESKLVAQHLMFVSEKLNMPPLPSVRRAAEDYYGNGALCDAFTRRLCTLLGGLTVAQQVDVLYNGANPKSRALADWWDKHQEADRKREEAEARAAKPTLKQAVVSVVALLDYSADGKVFPTEGGDQLPPKLAQAINDMTDAWNDGR